MTRHLFGGTIVDWTFTVGAENVATLASATVTFWNAQAGGTQYTDLASDITGTSTFDHVTSSDGTDGQVIGTISPFYGPDEVWAMWAAANNGPRLLVLAADVPQFVASNLQQLASLSSALTQHLAAVNPHATKLEDLADWLSGASPTDGQVPVWSASGAKWAPGAGGGGGGGVNLGGGSTIQIPNGDVTTMALRFLLPAGDRTTAGAPNTVSVQWNAGSDSAPNYQETFRLNEYGELRLQPSAINRVAERIKQFSGSQSSNLTEWTDFSNNVLASVGPNGVVRAPNLGMVLPFSLPGTVSTGTGTARLYNDTGVALTIRAVRASVGTAPTGASLIVDVKKGGTSIFTSGNRPTVTAGTNTSGKVTAIATTSLGDGEYLTVDCDQVGSTVAGSDLTVQILAY